MDAKLSLTAVVLTLNEKQRLERCLNSLRFAQQVVIIDSFSTDGTLKEAKRLWQSWGESDSSLVLIQQEWQGFEKTRNMSRSFASQNWILWVDADEWVSLELVEELRLLLNQPDRIETGPYVYRMPRLTYFLGRPIYHGGWYPDRKRRLAYKDKCVWKRGPHGADVHEDLFSTEDSRVGELKAHLYHETFRNVHEQEETNDRYSTLLAQGLFVTYRKEKRSPPTPIYISLKVFIKFIENYVFKLGILDGYPGFLIAKGSAKSLLLRYRKLRQMLTDAKAQES